jgi:hypothetical protein
MQPLNAFLKRKLGTVMKTLTVFVFLVLVKGLSGQIPGEIFIPAGAVASEVLTPDKIYQHPQFVLGKVLYRNGTETEALLNYNYLSGDIQFIGPRNDTLVIAKEQLADIKTIMINGHTYFYQQSYLEQVWENPLGKLLKRQMYLVVNRQKIGAYGQPTSLSAIFSYSNVIDRSGGVSQKLKVNENITLSLQTEYFIGDKNDNFLPATKKDIMRMYSSKKRQIEDYLKQNKVDFKNLEDLTKLFSSL